jgi:L-Lysine epsilon oxidase N-terminal/L-lysine epsilon oxidase C-terminal domain
MPTVYRIHPGVGIARLGNSPDQFCIAAEQPAALPIECDADGNSLPLGAPLGEEQPATKFKDDEGRIKRQAARFGVWVYDDENPDGRPLRLGDPIAGGGNQGTLIDIQWRVHLANKKASWYEFRQLEGEHGYQPDHPRRNGQVQGDNARQQLIIDPGPRVVSKTGRRRAHFGRDGGGVYAATFPPPTQPGQIDTLGELMTDDQARLLVLGGHGQSGTYLFDQFGQPRIDEYANNDGWFDDTSDGPVMARLVMHSEEVNATRFIDVEYPAWVIAAYPDYVPQIPDIVTMDEVVYDMAVRRFAYRTDLYGTAGTFDDPQRVDPLNTQALVMWQAGRLSWNADHRPWFYRDIWPILWRPEQYLYLTSVLSQSNDPHNQTARGTFDPQRIGTPPRVDWERVRACLRESLHPDAIADLVVAPIQGIVERLAREASEGGGTGDTSVLAERADAVSLARPLLEGLRAAVTEFAAAAQPEAQAQAQAQAVRAADAEDPALLAEGFAEGQADDARGEARSRLEDEVSRLLDGMGAPPPSGPEEGTALRTLAAPVYNSAPEDGRVMELRERVEIAVQRQLRRLHTGDIHGEAFRRCVAAATVDPYGPDRQFLFALLREPGEENRFARGGRATSRTHQLPLMPLLSGDNPITNVLPSKFLRLTDFQYYLLKQWAQGKFVNEYDEHWIPNPNTDDPYPGGPILTGRQLDQGVLSHVVGGAFCPGGEVGWIMRNPAIWRTPWRVKADPAFSEFTLTAAQANAWRGNIPETDYIAYADQALSQDDDFDTGMQPGDLTKHMALPWQADFNECSSQTIDVTYELWNVIDPDNPKDALMERQQRSWETLWWPAHRPMQNYEQVSVGPDGSRSYAWLDWARGVTQTNAGDLKMVTEWPRFTFVVRNPNPGNGDPTFIGVERTHRDKETAK